MNRWIKSVTKKTIIEKGTKAAGWLAGWLADQSGDKNNKNVEAAKEEGRGGALSILIVKPITYSHFDKPYLI